MNHEYAVTIDLPGRWALIEQASRLREAQYRRVPRATRLSANRKSFLTTANWRWPCDMLALYAGDNPVSRDFWWTLRDAAATMQLTDRAGRYKGFGANC
jgi:hypothetical protein